MGRRRSPAVARASLRPIRAMRAFARARLSLGIDAFQILIVCPLGLFFPESCRASLPHGDCPSTALGILVLLGFDFAITKPRAGAMTQPQPLEPALHGIGQGTCPYRVNGK